MLTGDQNIIDIAYSVRWNIRDPELYLFELAQPDDTIREVAESAMRAVVARSRSTMRSATGAATSKRSVADEHAAHPRCLSRRASSIQGIAIRQADPPQAVNEAFKEVTAAQQEAQSYINRANAYALQLPPRRRARRPRSTRSTSSTGSRPK